MKLAMHNADALIKGLGRAVVLRVTCPIWEKQVTVPLECIGNIKMSIGNSGASMRGSRCPHYAGVEFGSLLCNYDGTNLVEKLQEVLKGR